MKLFSTYSARMTLLRKEGYYMSKVQARRAINKLAVVLELDSEQIEKAIVILTCGSDGSMFPEREEGFTPSELQVIKNLSDWYSQDSEQAHRACFVALNLNRGFSLVISEGVKRPQMLSVNVKNIEWDLIPFNFIDLTDTLRDRACLPKVTGEIL